MIGRTPIHELLFRVSLTWEQERAYDVTLQACELAVIRRPIWWGWSVWMAGAITIHRIIIT